MPGELLAPGDGKVILSPGGDWFVDEKGQYYLVELERKPIYTVLRDQQRVMLPPGAAFELVEEREDTLVVKIYNADSFPPAPPPPASSAPALLADLADLEVASADRLKLVPSNQGLPSRGQWRQGFELVDLDGDGNLDIVHAPPRKGEAKPQIFLGDGQGGWRLWRAATFESAPLDYGDIAVADFDGDGALDIALAVHLRGLVVLRGDGRGNFRQWGEGLPYWAPGMPGDVPEFSARTLAAVDWNRDGRPDLLALGEGPRIVRKPGAAAPGFRSGERGPVLFLNREGGRWERFDQGVGRTVVFGDDLALGDFDGDGLTDFAVASRVRGSSALINLGKEDGGWQEVAIGNLARPGIYGAVHAADLDGDGRDELLLGYSAGAGVDRWSGIDLLEREEDGWRRTAILAEKGHDGPVTALATGDIDGDGRLDLVALTGSGARWILLGTAAATFVREISDELGPAVAGCQGYEAAVMHVGSARRAVVIMSFAGEPGSEQIFDTDMQRKCPSQGSLEAWTLAD